MLAKGWRIMWALAVYDCPMTDAQARHDYSVFRRYLLGENFIQVQNSLYVRHFPTQAAADAAVQRLGPHIPTGAQVAFFFITDKQYGMTREFWGRKPSKNRPNAPEQIALF